MHRVLRQLVALARDERGPTAIEYALALALIAGVIIAVVGILGTKTAGLFADTAAQIP